MISPPTYCVKGVTSARARVASAPHTSLTACKAPCRKQGSGSVTRGSRVGRTVEKSGINRDEGAGQCHTYQYLSYNLDPGRSVCGGSLQPAPLSHCTESKGKQG